MLQFSSCPCSPSVFLKVQSIFSSLVCLPIEKPWRCIATGFNVQTRSWCQGFLSRGPSPQGRAAAASGHCEAPDGLLLSHTVSEVEVPGWLSTCSQLRSRGGRCSTLFSITFVPAACFAGRMNHALRAALVVTHPRLSAAYDPLRGLLSGAPLGRGASITLAARRSAANRWLLCGERYVCVAAEDAHAAATLMTRGSGVCVHALASQVGCGGSAPLERSSTVFLQSFLTTGWKHGQIHICCVVCSLHSL